MAANGTIERLAAENAALRARLEEAEETLRAIREGEVDAVIVTGSQGDRVFSLMETENLHRLMVETMNEAGLAISRDGLLLYANDRASALLKRRRSSLLGHPIIDLVAPHDIDRWHALLESSIQGTADDRIVFLAADDSAVPMHLWVSRLVRPSGTLICLVGTDLSRLEADRALVAQLQEQQQALTASRAEAIELMRQALIAREQAAQSTRELRDSDRRKDAFLATLAHELRNPLATISNGLEVLRATAIRPDAAAEALDLIRRQLMHLVRLVDDLLEVSRITHGKIELRRERIALAAVIEGAAAAIRPSIDAAGKRLEVKLPRRPIRLSGDPVRLSQVFGNLLGNAAKYTEPGQGIRVQARRSKDWIRVSIQDEGAGIASDLLPHVFDMFSQGTSGGVAGHRGLGIGLALVKKLVDLHGGQVEARSAGPGRGSEFLVWLPSGDAVPGADPALPASRQAPEMRPAPTPGHILVVDDNRDAADSLALLLEIRGAQVEVSYDGVTALAALDRRRPDLVILDIAMPSMDGHEVARRIRANPGFREIPLIAMTGLSEEADRVRSLEAGFDRHLVKPISGEILDSILSGIPDRGGAPSPPTRSPASIESIAASLIHELAQPLSSAGCYALAARALAAGSADHKARLGDTLGRIDQQLRLADTIIGRLRTLFEARSGH